MPTLAEIAPTRREQAGDAPTPKVWQSSGEFTANDRFEATPPTYEQTTKESDATTAFDKKIDGGVLSEMPNSHPEVNAATISVNGLIKSCPHYTEMHQKDPERAKAEAAQTIQKAYYVSALREQGMSAKEIKAKIIADNLTRAKEKAKTVEKEEKAESRQKSFVDGFETVANVIEQTERAVKDRQVAPAEAQIDTAKHEERIKQQRVGAFIRYQKHFASQDKLPVDSPSSEELPKLQPSKTSVQELSVVVLVAVYENRKSLGITNANVEEAQQVTEVVSTVSANTSSELTLELEDVVQKNESKVDMLTLSLLEMAEVTTLVAEAEEQLELQFEPEVVDTYKQLLALIVDGNAEPDEPGESDERIAEIDDSVSHEKTKQDFEAFLALQLKPEEVVPLEVIMEQVTDEQPLEQTFVQLAQYLSDTLQETQGIAELPEEAMPELSEQQVELQTILQVIMEILPTCYSINEETQVKRIQITPEMTQKLLLLLRSLGYEHPQKVLHEFVSHRGFTFLFQALQYLYLLKDEENRQEFILQSTTYIQPDDESVRLRLTKMLSRLVFREVFLRSEPELLIANG